MHRVLGLDVRRGQNQAFLQALESLTATRCSIDRVTEERPTDPVNLLRDLRLALAQGDGRAAQDRLDALRETGSLSRENLRFLQVELLARFERWPELVSLPYFAELEKVRRPRRVSELMLEALWHIEVLRSGRPPAEAFRTRELPGRHRALLGSVDVPRQPGALALCYLSALADGDEARLDRLLASAAADRDYLESLNWAGEPSPEPLGDPVQEARRLLDRHQYRSSGGPVPRTTRIRTRGSRGRVGPGTRRSPGSRPGAGGSSKLSRRKLPSLAKALSGPGRT